MTPNERLETLAKFLENFPHDENQFEMSFYQCGTVCCAAGWAGHIPELETEGYKMEAYAGLSSHAYPTFQEYEEFKAIEKFFDLTFEESTHLFIPESYWDNSEPERFTSKKILPKEVAERIRALLQKRACVVS